MVPANTPMPPVSKAPATAFLPLKPFLSVWNWVPPHLGQWISFSMVFTFGTHENTKIKI
jgi:hypothetical protein